jgi:hypothetical protein
MSEFILGRSMAADPLAVPRRCRAGGVESDASVRIPRGGCGRIGEPIFSLATRHRVANTNELCKDGLSSPSRIACQTLVVSRDRAGRVGNRAQRKVVQIMF